MTTEAINHDPAHMFMNTGSQIAGRPSMGAWVTYGLGSEAARLTRLRGSHIPRQGGPEPTDRRSAVEQRFPAQPLPGSPASREGRPGPLLDNPAGRLARPARRRRQRHQRAQRPLRRAGARPRSRHARRPVRDGVPDAGQRPRADGRSRRERTDARARTAADRATARSLPTACWLDDLPSVACVSSSSTTRTGIIMVG